MDINEPLILKTAWETGHYWDRSYPDVLNVDQSSWGKLTARDRAAREAIASMQRADANFVALVQEEHGRDPIFDGQIGPATMRLVQGWTTKGHPLQRCPLPDFAPPPNATFGYDDPLIQQAVEKMQKAGHLPATGSGSWPATDGVHVVKISYDLSNAPSSVKGWFAEIKRLSHEVMAACGVKLVEVPVGEFANIRVSWRSLAGSTIGLAEFNNGSLEDSVFCYLDPNYAPDLIMVLLLLLHENGHNWNLNHRAGFIMNPSIIRVKAAWVIWKDIVNLITEYTDNSWPTMAKYFGGKPLASMPVPPVPPLPVPDTTIAEFDLAAGRYKLVRNAFIPPTVPPTTPPWRS